MHKLQVGRRHVRVDGEQAEKVRKLTQWRTTDSTETNGYVRTIHAPQDYDGSHDIHHLEHSPVENGAKDDGNAQSLSSASLVVHEMPAAMNGDHNGGGRHDVGLGVDAAFALYSLAQPALSLPRYIDRLPSVETSYIGTESHFDRKE